MDGVLIEAKEWHFEALNKALNLFGFNISRYEHLVTYDGLPTRKKLSMLTMEQGLPSDMHEFLNQLKQVYTLSITHARCNPTFQHEYALAKLKVMGYKLAVASNAVRQSVTVMMEKSNLTPYLDCIMSNEDVKEGKPHPEIYQKTIKALGIKPEECLVLEDNKNGIKAARDAGAHVMIIKEVTDVTFENIINEITTLEKQ